MIEEMEHADKLVDRILFLEGMPNLQLVAPLLIGQHIKEVLECDLKAEYSARDLYVRARELCRAKEDLVSIHLFEELLRDEEGHIDFLRPSSTCSTRSGCRATASCRRTRPIRWRVRRRLGRVPTRAERAHMVHGQTGPPLASGVPAVGLAWRCRRHKGRFRLVLRARGRVWPEDLSSTDELP